MAETRDPAGLIRLERPSGVPKVRQLVDRVCQLVREGALRRGDRVPSINGLARALRLSRDTVVKAYGRLKARGVLVSAHGKGFTVASSHVPGALRVFLLFDAFTPYKEILYEAMRAEAAGRLEFDIHFHHFRPDAFARLLDDARGRYGQYIVMPFPDDRVRGALGAIDQERLVLLDIDVDYPGKRCARVSQSHDGQLVTALDQAAARIRAYRSLTLVFPEDKNHPQVIQTAFRRFCRSRRIRHEIVRALDPGAVRKGRAFFVIEDTDLVALVRAARHRRLRLGRDLGILSYNDTPMKEVTDPGMSVVSIDFAELGRLAARQVLDPRGREERTVPTRFTDRGSL